MVILKRFENWEVEMEALLLFFAVWIILLLVAFIRVELVYRFRIKAIDEIFLRENWAELSKTLLHGSNSYARQLFSLTKWTYKQMFGDL